MTPRVIACIVEGHGEVEALPVLIRRIAAELGVPRPVQTPAPIRIPRNRLLHAKEFDRAVALARHKAGTNGRILVLIDGDDDCPAELGPELMTRLTAVSPLVRSAVVVAKREFEAWFLAAAESLRGLRDLDRHLGPPPDPESVSGAKEWLTDRMRGNRVYSETLDQAALAARFDLDAARRRSPSFDKCYRDVKRLLR